MPGDRGGFVVPSQPRRPSRSVRVPGRANGPVRVGHQPTGSLFAPPHGRAHTDDEMPQIPRGTALLQPEPAGASQASAGPDDTSPAGASPVGASPAESGRPEKSLAETRPADVTPADARSADAPPADNSPAEAGRADTNHADAQPSQKD